MSCALVNLISKRGFLLIGVLNLSKVVEVRSNEHRRFGLGRNTLGPIMDTDEEIKSSFRKIVDENKIVVFSKTTCPFCNRVKKLFDDLKENYHAFELDGYPGEKTSQMQNVLQEITGQRTVPNVFINKQHVGGCTDTEQALSDGTLHDRLDGTFQTYDYDYIVIGGGSGGLASAKEAVSHGRKVACCDLVLPSPQGTSWGLGGTCVNVGCIPKKLMHKAAIIGEDIKDAAHFGWTTDSKKHEWKDMVENIQNYIKSLNWKYRKDLKDKKVTYYNAYAKFIDKHTLELYDKNGKVKNTITGQNFLLAMGCRPVYPNFPGARDLCISSDDVFSMTEPPGKTLIIGASYIALETAGFLVGLGFDVTIMVRSILLRGFDQEIADMIGENLKAHGVKLIKNLVPESVTRVDENNLLVKAKSTNNGPEFNDTFKTVFLAVGREPCTKNMGLEGLNVKFQENSSRIEVNHLGQSSVRNIFAVGDVVEAKLQLTPVAIHAGKLLAKRLYGKGKSLFDYMHVPTTVFTPLEYGCVGYSEEEALEKFEQVEVYHLHFQPLEWELSSRNKNMSFGKLICLKNDNERVIGFHYLGPNAGEVTQGFALAMKLGATKEDFNNLIGIHPTCAEIFTTMTITKASGKSAQAGGC